ncbi:MAG: hypothetical protein M3Q56_08880 [Bacteroidota bacterium]|nr:hypothetical protein [Bacteroidota bacterium]
MNDVIKILLALILGLLIGYFYCIEYQCKGSDTGIPEICSNAKSCDFLVTIGSTQSGFVSVPNETADQNFTNYYNTPSTPMDAIGFSIERATVQFLANLVLNDPSAVVKGFRFYPGMTLGGQKEMYVISLNSDGWEIPGSIFKSTATSWQNGTRGPCPKWCDINSTSTPNARVIQE